MKPTCVAPFEMTVRVKPEDIDPLGHVNNVVYLRWAQEVAVAHWQAHAPAEAQARLVWVVLRHEVDYKHPARPGDTVKLRTWVGAASRFRFERFTEMTRAPDGRLLARVRTLWCPLDRATGRLAEVGSEVRSLFSTGAGPVRVQREPV